MEGEVAMEMVTEWIPGDVPPDEGYWQALLCDEENYEASPAVEVAAWGGQDLGAQQPGMPANAEDTWREACELMGRQELLELPVVGCNRGGVLVAWNGLRGFVPASHLVSISPTAGEEERLSDLQHMVGARLRLKIIELDPEQNRFVLSERATSQDEDRRQTFLDKLSPGDICQGTVTNLCSFGAFVDLGGLEGLIHVSELSWGRVEHPRDVLETGQPVEVYVINVDRSRGRVGLSLKRLQPDPWLFVEERYHVGQIVEGIITHVVDFGAFARVEDGLEGLIHVSELADGGLLNPRNVVNEGDAVKAVVINVDSERRRMGLSLRQIDEPYAVESSPDGLAGIEDG
ncbi:MAG: S1 RNA-binding domain-containing protein [Anaerolineae bacterium]|nr:S1 RNA-binding domain-containing protein [Anaerolineae bacterium]